MEELTEVSREVVSIGLDFRPIPINVGDGKIWGFTPDPDKAQWGTLTGTLKVLSKFKDISEEDAAQVDLSEAIDSLTGAVAALLADPEDVKAWKKRGYGLLAQQRVARALMEQWTGFPTTSSSPSGKKSKPTG